MGEPARIYNLFDDTEYGGGGGDGEGAQLVCPECDGEYFTVFEPIVLICTSCGTSCDPTLREE